MNESLKRYLVLTLFPEMFPGPLASSITGRALDQNHVSVEAVNIRDFTKDKHRVVDDTPYGGGSGMVMKPEPLAAALESARAQLPEGSPSILMTPQGEPFTQARAHELAQAPGL